MSLSLFKFCDNVAAAFAFKSASVVAVVAEVSLSGTRAVLLLALEFDIISLMNVRVRVREDG